MKEEKSRELKAALKENNEALPEWAIDNAINGFMRHYKQLPDEVALNEVIAYGTFMYALGFNVGQRDDSWIKA